MNYYAMQLYAYERLSELRRVGMQEQQLGRPAHGPSCPAPRSLFDHLAGYIRLSSMNRACPKLDCCSLRG